MESSRQTKMITFTAVLIALTVVTKALSIVTPITKITFSYIPIMLSGIFLGPIQGFIVGGLGDMISALLFPRGAWLPTLSIAAGLMGLIPGLIFKIKFSKNRENDWKFNWVKVLISAILNFALCTMFINSFTIFYFGGAANTTTLAAIFIERLATQPLVYAANIPIVIALSQVKPIIKLLSFAKKIEKQKNERTAEVLA
jgi:ECF transporter S component (folate family)